MKQKLKMLSVCSSLNILYITDFILRKNCADWPFYFLPSKLAFTLRESKICICTLTFIGASLHKKSGCLAGAFFMTSLRTLKKNLVILQPKYTKVRILWNFEARVFRFYLCFVFYFIRYTEYWENYIEYSENIIENISNVHLLYSTFLSYFVCLSFIFCYPIFSKNVCEEFLSCTLSAAVSACPFTATVV